MTFQIEYVRKRGEELVVTSEVTVEKPRLFIGSDETNDVVLEDIHVVKKHALIQLNSNQFEICSNNLAFKSLDVNDVFVSKKTLKEGDIVVFGHYRLSVLSINASDNLIKLQIETKAADKLAAEALKKRSTLSLKETSLNKRRNATKAFWLLLIAFLFVPIFAFFVPKSAESIRSTAIIPSDNSWSSGALTSVHHVVEKDCNACHKKAFTRVQDQACIECHKNISEHIKPSVSKKNSIPAVRCATCHQEHNGMSASLVNTNDKLCSNCHIDLAEKHEAFQSLKFKTFDKGHPELKVKLPIFKDGKFELISQFLADKNGKPLPLKEQSNLNFSHFIHLDKEGIRGGKNKKEVLKCNDCHQPTVSKTLFEPIVMEQHCQRCHSLGFESDDPKRQVPHGSRDAVLTMLKDYYAQRAISGHYPSALAPDVVQRKRPNKTITPQEKKQILAWVDDKSSDAIEELFYFTACVTCHQIAEQSGDKKVDVLPVNILPVRFSKANLFVHDEHGNLECSSCHYKNIDADSESDESLEKLMNSDLPSLSSGDVLMPQLSDCKECHSSEIVPNKVESTCIACHDFHAIDKHTMGVANQ